MVLKTYSHLAIGIPLILSCSLVSNSGDDPTVVGTITKSVDQDTVLPLSADDFTTLFNEYTNTSLAFVQMLSLPEHGTLKLKDIVVQLLQKIIVKDLDNLSFEPVAGWSGFVSFSWSGSDAMEDVKHMAQVIISIIKAPLDYCSDHPFVCYGLPPLVVVVSTVIGTILYVASNRMPSVDNRQIPIIPAPVQAAESKV